MMYDSQKLLQFNIDLHVWLRVTLSNHYIPGRMRIGPPASQCYCSSCDFALKDDTNLSAHQRKQLKTRTTWRRNITFVHRQCINLETSKTDGTWFYSPCLIKLLTCTWESVKLNHCVNDLTNFEIMIWCCEWKKNSVKSAVCFPRKDLKEILSNPWFMKKRKISLEL